MRKLNTAVWTTMLLAAAVSSHAAEMREAPPLVKQLKEGEAKIAPDASSIVDAKGRTLAKPVPVPSDSDYEGSFDPIFEAQYLKLVTTGEKPAVRKYVYTCSKKCALMEKKCFGEESGHIVCLNVCTSERLICEEQPLKLKPTAPATEADK